MLEEIGICVEEKFRGLVDEDWARRITQQVLKAEGVAPPYEVSIVFTDSKTVQRLNRDYRGVDEPTDVLAFSTREEIGVDLPPFVQPPDGVLHLGEVVISYPQAVIQSEEHQHSVKREIAILIIHGVLHLLGYEHDKLELESQMRAREAEILSYIEG